MTPNRIAIVVVFLLLAVLGWLWATGAVGGPGVATPGVSGAGQGGTAVAEGAGGGDGAAQRAEVDRAGGREQVDPEEVSFRVRGRCVAAADGRPLPSCAVSLRVESGPDARAAGWSDLGIATTVVTAGDGRFELGIAHDDWTDTVAVRLSAEGYVPRVGRWVQPDAGATIELGDVPMLRAIAVSGRVVDEQGLPVAGASMMFAYVELTGDSAVSAENMLRARSDAAGRFAFDLPAHPGEWYVGAEDTGALVRPRSVKLGDDDRDLVLEVVVERPDPRFSMTGTVVDTAQRPLAGVRVTATGEGFIGRGRSDAGGRFTVQRAGPTRDDGKPGTLLSCSDEAGIYDRILPALDERIPWGADDLRIVMQARTQCAVRVVDAQGRPVTDYTLFAFRGHGPVSLRSRASQKGQHVDGRCVLSGLAPGKHSVLVVPRSPLLASTPLIPFEVQAGVAQPELIVTVSPRVPVSLTVVGPSGAPVAGSRVELLQDLGEDEPSAFSAAVEVRFSDRERGTPDHVVVARGSTDARGVAAFSAPPGAWTLRLVGDTHVPQLQPLEVFAPGVHLRVQVLGGAMLSGRLEPPAAAATLRELAIGGEEPVAVLVEPVDGDALPPALVDEAGRYSIGGLAPGDYRLALRYWLRTGDVRADSVQLDIAEVSLRAGEQRELAVDVANLLPGTVTGRVVAGGEPLRDVHCFLRRNGPGKLLSLRVATDGDGRFTGVVPAGDYGFAITYPAQPGPGWLHIVVPDTWALAPGQQREVQLDVPLRRIRVQVVDDVGEPVGDLRVKIVDKGYFIPGGLKTDAAGWVEVFPAPLAGFYVEAEVGGEKRQLGPIDLPAGQNEGSVVVSLRAR